MDFAPMVALGIVALTLTNLVKYLRARNWNGVLTLLAAWAVGAGTLWLFGATAWAHGVTINGTSLDKLASLDKVVAGLVVASLGSFGFDIQKALDHTQSAATPQLLSGQTPPTVATAVEPIVVASPVVT